MDHIYTIKYFKYHWVVNPARGKWNSILKIRNQTTLNLVYPKLNNLN